ncbi:MAG: anhydro-N-acetylmuramic acid kinase, partial [Bacteroidetes bacterium]|nr:anhydro-N-acetylmuramic acid kinase [Bacteroidota bacterium]
MATLSELIKKNNKIVVGLMSGTSVDGIDAAVISIKGKGVSTKFKLLSFETVTYPKKIKELILLNSNPGKGTVDIISSLNVVVA